ncbi:MAG: hypothetical protein NTY09_05650 [bacterium]|nr:hypothetical protein [bacterium]
MPKRLLSLTVIVLTLIIAVPSFSGCTAIASYLIYQWMEDEFGSGSDPNREEPFVNKITIDREEVHINQQVLLTCDAEDQQDSSSELEYLWSVTGGEIVDPHSKVTIWKTPNQNGEVTLSVLVTDTDDNQASATVTVNVLL